MSSRAPEPPARRPDLNWDRGSVAVRDPVESSTDEPALSTNAVGLAGRVRRLARFLYRLLTETP